MTGPHSKAELLGAEPTCYILPIHSQQWYSIQELDSLERLNHGDIPLVPPAQVTPAAPNWYYSEGSETQGPLLKEDLLIKLRHVKSLDVIMIWNENLTDWQSVYQFPDILNTLGICRRENLRLDLSGQALISITGQESQPPQVAKLFSISLQGIGVTGAILTKGLKVKIEIQSEQLATIIKIDAETLGTNKDGMTSFEFTQLLPEMQSIIADYLRTSASFAQAA